MARVYGAAIAYCYANFREAQRDSSIGRQKYAFAYCSLGLGPTARASAFTNAFTAGAFNQCNLPRNTAALMTSPPYRILQSGKHIYWTVLKARDTASVSGSETGYERRLRIPW